MSDIGRATEGAGRMRQVFVDMDGVLADFDSMYEAVFGVTLDRNGSEPPDLWQNIRDYRGRFFLELPLEDDARVLWDGVRALYPQPIILSGADPRKYPGIIEQKQEWITQHIGLGVPLITCRSRDKCKHGKPGDILIDDWKKYRHLWEQMGGTFILHTSAVESLSQLAELLPTGAADLGGQA